MTLLERARADHLATPAWSRSSIRSHPGRGGLSPWRLRLRGAAAGAFSVGAPLVVLALPILLAWVASPDSTVGWASALGLTAGTWLLGTGVTLHVGAASLSLTPLLLTASQLASAWFCARHLLRAELDDDSAHRLSGGRLRRAVGDCGAGFVVAYLLSGIALSLVVRAVGVTVAPAAAALPMLWGTVGFAAAALATRGDDLLAGRGHAPGASEAGATGGRRPLGAMAGGLSLNLRPYLARAVVPAGWGTSALLGAGGLLVVGSVVAHLGRVIDLSSSLGGGVSGQLVLAVGQILVLPNLAMWALSFLAGPGFTLATGTSVTWSASHPGLLPVIPVLGALPDPGRLPGWLVVGAAVPACAGMLVAWRSQRTMTALTSWRFRLQVTASAVLLIAVGLLALAWASGGSLGSARLAAVGPPALLSAAALSGELAVGALLGCLVLGWRARRGVRDTAGKDASTHAGQD